MSPYAGLTRRAVEQTCERYKKRAVEAEGRVAKEQRLLEEERRLRQAVEAERDELDRMLEILRAEIFAPRTERSRTDDPNQTMFLDAPASNLPDPSESEPEEEEITYKRKKSKGRKPVSKDLPEKVIVLRASDEDRIGPDGQPLVSIGWEETRILDIVPERIQCLVIRREKLGLADTRELAHTVPMPGRLVPGGKASDAFMLHATLQKYDMGLPLYRQTAAYNRLGAELSDNFLGECVRHIAGAFQPIAAAIRDQVLSCEWVFADETPVRQLNGKEEASTSYFWAWVAGRQVYFHFGQTRSAKEVRDMLGIPYDTDDPRRGDNADLDPTRWEHGEWIGFLICDGHGGYNPAFLSETIIRVACWVHARRRFKKLEKLDKNAAKVVGMINGLFRIDRAIRKEADKRGLAEGTQQRYEFIAEQRKERVPDRMAELKAEIDLLEPIYSPDTTMGGAITYINNRWDELQVYIEHGFLPMENNTAERAIRPIAVGRKAWLFVGSEDGGSWAATMFSVIESCRLQEIDVTAYCERVLREIVDAPDRDQIDYHALTPARLRDELRGSVANDAGDPS